MNDLLDIKTHCSLKELNTFGIDAIASSVVFLHDQQDYVHLVESELLLNNPYLILGGGSNVLFTNDFNGIVVHPMNRELHVVERKDDCCYIEVGAGWTLDEFIRYCIEHQLYGLENLASIPGTVGAAPVQNVGAYGVEAKDRISRVHLFNAVTKQSYWLNNADCHFGYRWSIFKELKAWPLIVDKVQFCLSTTFQPIIEYSALNQRLEELRIQIPTAMQMYQLVSDIRDSKLPRPDQMGSAGSFFKNPIVDQQQYARLVNQFPDIVAYPVPNGYKLSAGWLIENAGWKGRSLGNAAVYDKQALVLVNRGYCSGNEILALAHAIIDDVSNLFGVLLQPEVIII